MTVAPNPNDKLDLLIPSLKSSVIAREPVVCLIQGTRNLTVSSAGVGVGVMAVILLGWNGQRVDRVVTIVLGVPGAWKGVAVCEWC